MFAQAALCLHEKFRKAGTKSRARKRRQLPTRDAFRDPRADNDAAPPGQPGPSLEQNLAWIEGLIGGRDGDVLNLIPKGAATVPKTIPRRAQDDYRNALAETLDKAASDWRAAIAAELFPALMMANLPRRSAQQEKEVRRRARRFQAGHWAELFDHADLPPSPRSVRSNDALSSLENADRRRAKAAAAALNMGSVSKASQLLSSPATIASITAEQAVAEFQAVNPLPGQVAPPLPPHPDAEDQQTTHGTRTRSPLDPPTNPNRDPDPLPTQAFLKAAKSLDKAKAKGSTGLGNGHLRLLLGKDDAIAASEARYLNSLRRGDWNPHLRRLLNAGEGLPLAQEKGPTDRHSIGHPSTRRARGDAWHPRRHGAVLPAWPRPRAPMGGGR